MRRLTLAFCACLSLGGTAAVAQTRAAPLSVGAGQATQLSLATPVRDIVVGDPTVADVSIINDRTLVVLGKKAGATTLLAFDVRGQALADRQIVVSDIPDQAIVVQRGVIASTYACGDRCSKLGGGGDAPAIDAPVK